MKKMTILTLISLFMFCMIGTAVATEKATQEECMAKCKEAVRMVKEAEFINVAKGKGAGWVDYMWPKPGEKKPSLKTTYVYKVPGESVIMAAGIYK